MGGAASMPQQLAELDTHPVDVRHDKSTDCSIAVKFILPRDGPTFSRYELQMQRADTRDGEWRTVGAFFKGGTGTAGALQPCTAYKFRARGIINGQGAYAWGKPSAGMLTESKAPAK